MNIKSLVSAAVKRYQESAGVVGGIFNFFCGRSTFFAILFTIVGIIQELRGRLSGNFVLLIGAIQSLVVLHSAKEDYRAAQTTGQDITNINTVPKA
ncbi:MAG: hypothetical protein WAU89_17975 [Candidatus Acidiferrales bacterium]